VSCFRPMRRPRPGVGTMSLKAFHVLFISLSVLLCWGFGVWCFVSQATREGVAFQVAGGASFALGVGLTIYEIRFVKKMSQIEAR